VNFPSVNNSSVCIHTRVIDYAEMFIFLLHLNGSFFASSSYLLQCILYINCLHSGSMLVHIWSSKFYIIHSIINVRVKSLVDFTFERFHLNNNTNCLLFPFCKRKVRKLLFTDGKFTMGKLKSYLLS
jgi:hypothetical protein